MTKQAAQPQLPSLPIDDLERFAARGVVASMDAAALGAFVRLLSYAWREQPPCTLPADDATLAFVARSHEWDRVRPSLLVAFVPSTDHPGRLINRQAREIFDSLAAEVAAFSEKQRRASQARWGKPADPGGMPVGSHRDASGMPAGSSARSAPSLRSESSSLSLPRSQSTNESSRSSERSESEGTVIAQLGDRARAIGDERIGDWKRRQSLELLQKAIAGWRNSGLSEYPISNASKLASGPHSDPARVQAVLEDIAGQIAAGKMRNPVGYLLCGLALAANRNGATRPAEIPLQLAQKWAAAEASQRKTFETVNAIQAAANRIRAAQPSITAQAGGA